jgi:hypothetical protein
VREGGFGGRRIAGVEQGIAEIVVELRLAGLERDGMQEGGNGLLMPPRRSERRAEVRPCQRRIRQQVGHAAMDGNGIFVPPGGFQCQAEIADDVWRVGRGGGGLAEKLDGPFGAAALTGLLAEDVKGTGIPALGT